MRLTRRDLTLLAAAGLLVPSLAHAEPPMPLVIAHRGASGERPEETRLAYDLAIDEGADFIEPDLVPTKDGILVARHENELSGTTDVATHTEFADRKTTKTIDGARVTGWFTEDFTLAELKTLMCRERLPQIRPANAKFDGKQPILTFQEVIDIARAGCVRTARVIGIYPEMKHPTYFASIGLPLEERLAGALRSNGYNSPASAVFVQCFEVQALKTFGRFCRARRVQLIGADGGPADQPNLKYKDMITPAGLTAIKAYANAIGPDQSLLLDFNAPTFPVQTNLVNDAHATGLQVHCWTARQENMFLPKALQRGNAKSADFPGKKGDIDKFLVGLFMTGVDGVFSDFPALAFKARDDAMRAMAKAKPAGR